MDKLAVVILNYNGRKHLETFLPSVVAHSSDFPVYVADNGSSDDSVLFLENNFPQVKIIRFDTNNGFSKGYNLALEQIKAEYYVLLNSDVEVTPNWILPVLALMEKDKNIAACQPKILSYLNRQQFEYAGAAGGFLDRYGYPFCRGRLFDTLEDDKGQYDDETEIFWATGACMFVRAEIYHQLGGLDEDFFAHMEEIDLCWRIKSAGYKVFYTCKSTVFHLGGGTLAKSNPRKTFLNFRNGILLLYKNLPEQKLLPIIFARLVLDGIAGIKFLLAFSVNDCLAIIKAHFDFYGRIQHWQKSRQKSLAIKKAEVELWNKSVVKAYFLEKKKVFRMLKIDNK